MTSSTFKGSSPLAYARIAGALYLLIIVLGIFAEVFVRDRLTVSRDAAATAHNILTHELLFRFGFAAEIIVVFCATVVLLILYDLLKVVSRNLALLAVFFNLVAISIQSVNLLNHFAPLILLHGERYLGPSNAELLPALAYMSLRLQSAGYDISLAFFGCFCVCVGYLIFRSTFLPRIIGVLMAIAGLCYLINSFTNFLAPRLSLFPYILMPCLLGEASLCLWLLVKGIHVAKWEEQASLSTGSSH